MRTKPGIDTLSFDDLYNNLRVFESDVKGSTASSSSTQNVAFVSKNTSSTNEVSTAYGASSSFGHKPQREGSSLYTDDLIFYFFANQSSGPQLDHDDLEQLDEFDLEEMDLKWQVAMISMKIKKSKGNQESMRRDAWNSGYKAKDNGTRPGKQEETKALSLRIPLVSSLVLKKNTVITRQRPCVAFLSDKQHKCGHFERSWKSAFLYGKIDEEVYVSQPPGFVDPKYPKKVYKVVKALYGLHQAPKAELDILKKFKFASVKTTSTPIETQKPLVKDEEATDSVLAQGFRVSSFDLEAYSDSDYAGANLDRKYTTGGCQFLGRRLISWQCKKQTIVTTSTTEAEYVAIVNCCGQVLWIQNQMLDYGFNFMNTKIYIDNESTICIVKNLVFHSKTKHIEIRHHFIRDAYEKKLIQVLKIHTDDNVADLLTKGFDVSSLYEVLCEQKDLDHVSTTFVEQFWMSAKSKPINNVRYITAKVAGKPVTIPEASIRSDLLFDDTDGIDTLNNQAIFDTIQLMGHLDAKKKFVMYPRFILVFLANQLKNVSVPLDHFPINALTSKVFSFMVKKGKNFSGNVTHLFPSMLVQPTEDEGAVLARPSDSQPVPSPPYPSADQPKAQTDPSLRPSPFIPIPDSIPEGSGGNHVGQSSSDRSLSGNEDGLTLQSVYDLYVSLCIQVTAQAKEIKNLKAQIKKLKNKARPGRKSAKSKPTAHNDQVFDDLDDFDGMDYMETKDAYNEKGLDEGTAKPKDGNSEESATPTAPTTTSTPTPTVFGDDETIVEFLVSMSQNKAKQAEVNKRMCKGTGERENRPVWNNVNRVNPQNQFVPTAVLTRTGKIPVNTARASSTKNVGTARHNFNSQAVLTNAARKINTVKPLVNNVSATPTAPTTTSTPTPTVFGDDETIAKFLVSMSQNKAKQKGVEIKDAEDSDRARPTLTRSLLTLKPLPKIDPKDKGKKVLEEEAESDAELEGVNEAKRKFAQLANDEEIARKARIEADSILAARLQEEEREKFTIEERAKLLHDTIAAQRRFLAQQRAAEIRSRPPIRTHLRNQMMTYLKHVGGRKHSDLKNKIFEEKQVLYEKVKSSDKNFVAIGSAEDERIIRELNKKAAGTKKADSIKEESKEEAGTRKRKLGTRKKMKSRKRRFRHGTSEDEKEI
ncbi:putative ribonuclease H-like domain-containing protein [Tanacetum coccineum]|uniref:Ribonuclease H-like domain-containing protein n=1 Tax=Tanacetum coccineum TaxID=301880 RepID=A0ABQ5DB94_9ASTR